jgi:hypothetical protein
MRRLPLQQTRYNSMLVAFGAGVRAAVGDSWRVFSLQLLALLVGVYLGSNLTSYVLLRIPGGRPSALPWVICDNLRISAVYAVVLEAFKVGT